MHPGGNSFCVILWKKLIVDFVQSGIKKTIPPTKRMFHHCIIEYVFRLRSLFGGHKAHNAPLTIKKFRMYFLFKQVTLLIAFLCVHCESRWTDYSAFRYFEVVTVWFLIVFLFFFLMYVMRLQGKIPCINWTLTVSQHIIFPWHVLWSFRKFLNDFVSYTDFHIPLQEFLHYAVGGILVIIASIVAAMKSHGISGLVAGSVSWFFVFKCKCLPV